MEATVEEDAGVLLRTVLRSTSGASEDEPYEEQSAALQRMVHLSRSPEVRALLASHDAVPALLSLLAQNPPSPLLILKLLRNLCADSSNQEAFLRSFGADSVALVVDKALQKPAEMEMASILQVCLQILGNACGGGKAQREAVWKAFFPDRFNSLVLVKWEDKVLEPLCMVLYTCCHGDIHKSKELCHGDGISLLSSCWRAAASNGVLHNGAGDWIYPLISDLCLGQPLLPFLFSNFRVLSKECAQEPLYSEEQASLLGCVLDMLAEKAQAPDAISQEDKIDFLGLTDFLARILRIASHSYRNTTSDVQLAHTSIPSVGPPYAELPCGFPIIDILGSTLELLKILSGWEHGGKHDRSTIVAELLHRGVIALCLELLKGLGPPELIYKAMQRGKAEVTDAHKDIAPKHVEGAVSEGSGLQENQAEEPSRVTREMLPYKGYRRDLVAVLGNAAYQSRAVQDEVRNLGGLHLVLQQCVVDEANPYLREWGLWAIRNLVDGNMENCKEIAELQLRGSLTPVELAEMGYNVEMDAVLGRPKLVNTPSVRE